MFKIRFFFLVLFLCCNALWAERGTMNHSMDDMNSNHDCSCCSVHKCNGVFVVDLEKVGRESEIIRNIFQKIDERQEKINEFMQISENLDNEMKDLETKKSVIKDYQKRHNALQKEIDDNKTDIQSHMTEAQEISRQVIGKCEECIKQAIMMVVEDKKIGNMNVVVLYKQGIAYMSGDSEITEIVQKELEIILSKEQSSLEMMIDSKNDMSDMKMNKKNMKMNGN